MLVADGVLPSAGGRGHVMRRLIRRVLGRLRRLDLPSKTLTDLIPSVLEGRVPLRPELVDVRPIVESVLTAESEAFDRALRQGSRLLRRAIRRTLERSETVLPGESAFELYDACGMPLELTIELAHESGLTVDVERFEELMAKHRERSGG
jgi:alanyl-tRNA synthetase